MKKKVCLLLVILILIIGLCGCSNLSGKELTQGDYKNWTIEIKNLWEKNSNHNYILNLGDVIHGSSNNEKTNMF